jgi:hypothetical protein
MSDPKASQESEKPEICPYWHQVTADFTSMYPSGGYCIAGCHQRVKVMADKTVQDLCAMNFGECEGYNRLLNEDEESEHQSQDSIWR